MSRFKLLTYIVLLTLLAAGLSACDYVEEYIYDSETYELSISKIGEGDLEPAQGVHDFDKESIVNIEAQPTGWSKFSHWLGDAAEQYSQNTTVMMDENKSVTAVFDSKEYNTHSNNYYYIRYPTYWESSVENRILQFDTEHEGDMMVARERRNDTIREYEFRMAMYQLERELEDEGIYIEKSKSSSLDGQRARTFVLKGERDIVPFSLNMEAFNTEKNLLENINERENNELIKPLSTNEESKARVVLTYKGHNVFILAYFNDKDNYPYGLEDARRVINSFEFQY